MDSKKSMEIKIMYCRDLKAFNFFQKLLLYVLVSLVSDDPDKKLKQNQQQRTPTDSEGDGDPEWNHEMQFDLSEISFLDCDNFFFQFDICHGGLYFGDKIIGEVRVPLKDLIQESSGIQRFANYQVRSPDGKPNGMLNFSYKVNVKGEDMGINSTTSQTTGYSVVVHHHHQPPETQYPSSQIESSSPGIHYPSFGLEGNSQEIYPAAGPAIYPPHETQYSTQESHYPPTPYAYYPPSQPAPPPFPHHRPPPAYGACYHPPYPPGFRPSSSGRTYYYSAHTNWSPTGGQSYSFGHGERWRNDYRDYWNCR